MWLSPIATNFFAGRKLGATVILEEIHPMVIRPEKVVAGTLVGVLGGTIAGESLEFSRDHELSPVRGARPIDVVPRQEHAARPDDGPQRESSGAITLRFPRFSVGSTGTIFGPVALSSDAAPDLRYVSVPVTINGERIVFGQERFRST